MTKVIKTETFYHSQCDLTHGDEFQQVSQTHNVFRLRSRGATNISLRKCSSKFRVHTAITCVFALFPPAVGCKHLVGWEHKSFSCSPMGNGFQILISRCI